MRGRERAAKNRKNEDEEGEQQKEDIPSSKYRESTVSSFRTGTVCSSLKPACEEDTGTSEGQVFGGNHSEKKHK
jgi:hypothetical protein